MNKVQAGVLAGALALTGVVFAQPERGFFGGDTDGDGVLTRAEADAALDERFARLDTNADGAISREEVAAARDARREGFAERARARFAEADTDADGSLSLAELQAVNPNMTQERFERMDRDGNGLISADERPGRQRRGRPFGPGRP